MRRLPYLVFSALVLIGCGSRPAFSLPAFPGAEGFGSETPGGRGGKVIEVTNLNDSGAGSLRAALTASAPRIVVFRVAGTIELLSRINVTDPYLTVAGQTAPGDGITIKNHASNGKGPLKINTHDVVLRYLRIRSSPSPNDGGTMGALSMNPAPYNIIVDHCSFSWGTDEVFRTGGAHDFTLQWSIVSEGLNNSTHPEGAHSKGVHFRDANSDNISMHHNLVAHNYDRNPNINTTGVVDLVNNVFYNATRWTEIKDKFGEPKVNIVNNYYKQGPSSESDGYEVFYYDSAGRQPKVFVQGNIGFHRPADNLPEELIVRDDSRWMIVNSRFPAPQVTTVSAFDAFDQVLAEAGATLPVGDAHDAAVADDVRNGTGELIDDPSDVGGWFEMAPGTPAVDTDHDGMPDEWEQLHGFNVTNTADGPQDADDDGYTNVEEYLNETDPWVVGGEPVSPPPSTSGNTAPAVNITEPANGSTFAAGAAITFTGTATDFEDGDLTGSLRWTSSIDGALGNGDSITTSTLSVGTHTITASAADSGGLADSATVTVTVNAAAAVGGGNTVEVRVSSSSDDAEESVATGGMESLKSSDLELTLEKAGNQIVGMRFNAVAIPQGATIQNAYLQFTVDETSSTATTLQIWGQAADNPSTFTTATGDISSRPKTGTSVSWSPAPWLTAGESGPDQMTPNIANVIQEIVNRPGWTSGNSLVVTLTGDGERIAESFDGVPSAAPLLHVEYSTQPEPEPTGDSASNILTFVPIADATIKADSPEVNYGSSSRLEADSNSEQQFLIKFAASGIGTGQVTSAKLRLYNINSSNKGGDFYQVAETWSEGDVTWHNAPPINDETKLASLGAVTKGNWYEVDITPLITGESVYSLLVKSTSSNGADYNSKEATEFSPQLVVTVDQ